MSDESQKFSPEQPKDKIEDLNAQPITDRDAQPITDRDAQSVKGGRGALKIGDIKGEYLDSK